jgi:DNA-binding response OmpR family regulator
VDALLRRLAYREGEKNREWNSSRQDDKVVGTEVTEGMDRVAGDDESEGDALFRFDFDTLQFWKGNESVDLSKTEIKLLQLLWTNKGHVLSREKLLSGIWPDGTQYVDENALSVAVRRLRAKLEEDPSAPRYIKTVHGLGYMWE